ncbi:MAG: transporter, family, methylenomycin resistance protein, partial [Actinomycetota bacterium]|nr:transporter, family, methylenomycin resistance protein [Actinomycetota bacterium]
MTVFYREGGAGSTPINVLSHAVTGRGLLRAAPKSPKELHLLMTHTNLRSQPSRPLDGPDRREEPVSIHSSPDFTLAAAVLGFFVITLDAVVVNVALPSIRRDFGGGMSGLQWVVDGYTLMFAALLLWSGALSDRAGARRAFAAGLGLFVAASAACGLAPNQAGTASGVFNTSRQLGGALAVAVFGALLAKQG